MKIIEVGVEEDERAAIGGWIESASREDLLACFEDFYTYEERVDMPEDSLRADLQEWLGYSSVRSFCSDCNIKLVVVGLKEERDMKTFYAASNLYGSSTSVGFANTWFVKGFRSKKARDSYVANAEDRATRAISRAEIRKYADRERIDHGYDEGRLGYVIWDGDSVSEWPEILDVILL